MMTDSIEKQEHRVLREEIVAKGDWLALKNIFWIDGRNKERVWEGVCRTTKGTSEIDCIGIAAILRRQGHKDALVAVKQFRPAVGAYTLEMPAGLVDSGESPEKTVHRELLEETGLQGKMKYFGPSTGLNPALSSDRMKLAFVEIDGDAPENQVKEPIHGVDGESIEVLYVPIDEIIKKLKEYAQSGLVIESRLDALAFGLQFNNLIQGKEKT